MNLKILLIIFFEIIIISLVGISIWNKKSQPANIFFIKNDYYLYPHKDNLRYYYELKPNLGQIDDLIPKPEWLNYVPVYKINKDGLNERYDYSTEKSDKTYRIITLGDSFTFGLFVNTKDNWSEKLEDELNRNLKCVSLKKFEVINLAVGGYDLIYEIERYKLKGQKYNPDLLLWLLKDEDFEWINEYLQPELNSFEKLIKENKVQNNIANWKQFWIKTNIKYSREISKQKLLNLQTKKLLSISNYFKNRLALLNLPRYSVNKDYLNIENNLINSRNQSYLHTLPDILSLEGTFPESHPNKKGHELIAQDIFNYLIRNKIISCD